jgi:hypothetical protein
MLTFNTIKDLTSSEEEYEQLYNTDHIFIVKGHTPDDNELITAISEIEGHSWRQKLRGPNNGPYKIANRKNDHQWCHGYIYGVDSENLKKFESCVIITSLTYGYQFEKLDVSFSKKEVINQHFSSLFEEM